jgi:hypothetical protein
MSTDPADPRLEGAITNNTDDGVGPSTPCSWDPNEPTKQCWICDIQVGEKSMHCKFCNKCVDRFDHHCMCKFVALIFLNRKRFTDCLTALVQGSTPVLAKPTTLIFSEL